MCSKCNRITAYTSEGLRARVVQLKKKRNLRHIEVDVDNICQWKNGLIQMDHITPHTSHVKF